jgi:hypothetical protein
MGLQNFLNCYPKKFSPAARILAAKEHKEPKERLFLCGLCELGVEGQIQDRK